MPKMSRKGLLEVDRLKERKEWLHLLQSEQLDQDERLAVADNFGTAVLMEVRDAYKSVWICILYTIFVAAACFHSMNGIWTFAISWGCIITERARKITRRVCTAIMIIIAFLGFAAIWGTYWVNLRY